MGDITGTFAFLGFTAAMIAAYWIGRFHAAGHRWFDEPAKVSEQDVASLLLRLRERDLNEADIEDWSVVREAELRGLVSCGGGWGVGVYLTASGREALSAAGPTPEAANIQARALQARAFR